MAWREFRMRPNSRYSNSSGAEKFRQVKLRRREPDRRPGGGNRALHPTFVALEFHIRHMKGGKMAALKSCVLALTAALALNLCGSPMLLAQSPQGSVTYGTFGNRTLGQSFVPQPRTFGGGIQTGASGNFLYLGRPDGVAAFATPWRQTDPAALELAFGLTRTAQPTPNAAVPPQSSAPAYNGPGPPASAGLAVPSFPGTNGWEAVGAALPSPGPAHYVATGAGPASPRAGQPFVRSAEISAELTRIARANGMLAGPGIDVYLRNHVAVMEGAVRTQADRVLLANVLALEPQVRQTDSRLIIAGSGTRPAQ